MTVTFTYLKGLEVRQELDFLGVDSDLELESIGGNSRKADVGLKIINS